MSSFYIYKIFNDQPRGVLVLPPNNLLSSNLLSSDEIAMGFSVVLLGDKKFELENLIIKGFRGYK